MCSPEEAALLRLEEVHSATLARINSLILQPLLSADPEPSEPQARECLRLLQELHRSSQELWEVTEESLRSLWERQRHPHSIGLESLLLLRSPDRVLQVHMEYIESYTSCLVVQAFQKVAKRKSEYWRGQRKALRQLLTGMSSECSVGTTLAQALRQPLTQHVQQYVLLLLSLRDTIGERHPAKELVMHAVTLFGNLQSFMGQALDQAVATQALWHTLSSRQRDVLCTPAHRLLQDSQDVPVTVTPLRAERVLLFDDALVLLQGHNVHTFDLKLLWVDPGQERCMFHLLTPEEELSFCARDPQSQVVWQWKVTQAVCQALCGKKDFPVLGTGLEPAEPPACRCGSYTFRAEGRLCQATYEGEWFRGRPHGKGTLKWPNGRNHVGNFREGLEQGFGIHLVPQATEDKFDCYKCHWQEGSMCGYGICEYSSDEVYKGYFQDGLRHGFGVLDSAPQAPQPFRYTGHWEKGQRSGFGIQEDSDRGERYIGMWRADQRHGPGVVVTQAGVCYQGTFQVDKMVGPGVLLSEDDSLYEGSFTRDLTLVGKGKVTFPNGFTLEGSFSSGTGKGLYTQGVLDTAALPPDPSSTCKRQLGLGAFPVESRWQGVYNPFRDFVRAGCPGDLQEALLGFHVQSSRELRKSQEYLCCERSHPEDSAGSVEDILEELLQHREPETLQQYLRKALSNARHPLGKLLQTLMLTFQASYAGVGANKHLQGLAQEEVKQHAQELWAAYRGLLQVALQRKGQALEEEDEETRELHVHGLMLPLVLPSFYSELFTLYLLLHEREDSLYSQGITNLSLFPDTKLLEFLDVQKHLWPLKDLKLTTNQRYSLVRDKCFLSATECLQKIMTTVDPREKLEVLEKTYGEIEATVTRVLGREHKLPMDDLLPLLIYVVSRARIQHLGAEIHLIRDMMDPVHIGGLYDFLLTALESCYEHIQKEDMRLRHLPGHWDSRELW
ncbi:ALS2 C-terminal-like protein isoform X1 [Sciurus carolinensis]|uniref:ALS2 C-terminal-like protein isoform X1 n=1 Tax=Sciurus carolinensis TaxID=30640 RepID=UPI001FB429A0|nr:ALS2 C-terminal-like protein isoform X1 [Sciurus carolinensis]XP_047388299.1 ALS2 C-terminal-like protein isoform X1 [Sciurus carolinensis]XP_047388300.1 ALS2 C-terminal-like protein isoform X1 [Sciurus carolinensis]XP_047388301.1 ALS2 C-terminal-like protein isoform X1 [Sciurus carolinensis]XP_047388302.1 ALS2 C-terminal-like protein isoform X1 [Sciurus carolinensis]XP_047388303.1 ALS2 C-terminal-like protein isoform X1 [Sciurus carolinensis]XP_047388304.1 ALS2 C-terminal-like protein iso